jgi:hypothetical protein
MKFAGHVARVGDTRNASKCLSEHMKERHYFEDLGVDRRIILK